jgi:hypothetical protein
MKRSIGITLAAFALLGAFGAGTAAADPSNNPDNKNIRVVFGVPCSNGETIASVAVGKGLWTIAHVISTSTDPDSTSNFVVQGIVVNDPAHGVFEFWHDHLNESSGLTACFAVVPGEVGQLINVTLYGFFTPAH